MIRIIIVHKQLIKHGQQLLSHSDIITCITKTTIINVHCFLLIWKCRSIVLVFSHDIVCRFTVVVLLFKSRFWEPCFLLMRVWYVCVYGVFTPLLCVVTCSRPADFIASQLCIIIRTLFQIISLYEMFLHFILL